MGEAALGRLKELVVERNGRTLAECVAGLSARAGVEASGPTVCRALAKLGLIPLSG